jgi:hypothetical protein
MVNISISGHKTYDLKGGVLKQLILKSSFNAKFIVI